MFQYKEAPGESTVKKSPAWYTHPVNSSNILWIGRIILNRKNTSGLKKEYVAIFISEIVNSRRTEIRTLVPTLENYIIISDLKQNSFGPNRSCDQIEIYSAQSQIEQIFHLIWNMLPVNIWSSYTITHFKSPSSRLIGVSHKLNGTYLSRGAFNDKLSNI